MPSRASACSVSNKLQQMILPEPAEKNQRQRLLLAASCQLDQRAIAQQPHQMKGRLDWGPWGALG